MTPDQRFNVIVNHAFGGWHHVGPRKDLHRSTVSFTVGGDISTYDWTVLTRLVLAAHAVRVRVELTNGGPRRLKVFLSLRENTPKDWATHHPDLDDLIALARTLKDEVYGDPKPTLTI